jgi:hypothetical protein
MKFTWMKWSALPVAVLMAGSVAMAQDQSSSGSQQPAPAQSGTPATAPAATPAPAAKPTIAQRKENQQDRIAQGVKSGQLTAGETSKLETKEAAINGETKADRAGQRRQTDHRRKTANQQGTERRVEEHLQQEAQRQDATATQEVSLLHP